MFNSKRMRSWFSWKMPPAAAAATPADSSTSTPLPTSATSDSSRVIGITTADRPANAERPRRRRRRRTESPTGLPLYAEEPRDDEMSLFRHHEGPARSSHVDLRDVSTYGGSSQGHGDDGASSIYRPSMDASASSADLHFGRSRSASDASPSLLGGYPSTPPRQSSDYANDSSTTSSLFIRPPTGHRSTHSSPAISPSPPFIGSTGRSRSSTLRSIFARNRSSSFLSSSPGAGGSIGRSPYGQLGSSGSTSRLASSSTASISSQIISAPLQHTLVSSSFVYPKNGPTPSQIAFISSRDSLGAYGYGDGVAQIPSYEEGSSPLDELAPPPVLSGASAPSSSMAVPTGGGRFRASSVSSQLSVSSPLARSVSDPVSPTLDQDEEGGDNGQRREPGLEGPPIPSYEELHPSSTSPSAIASLPTSELPPAISLSLPAPLNISIPTLNLGDTSSSSTPFATPRSGSPSFDTSSEPTTATTSKPPTLPALVFFNATPTSSSAPSPVIQVGAGGGEERIPVARGTGTGVGVGVGVGRREQNFSSISEASFMTQGSWATAESSGAGDVELELGAEQRAVGMGL